MKKSIIVKAASLMLAVSMIFGFSGCKIGGSSSSDSSDAESEINYSIDLDDDGFYEECKVADYVKIDKYKGIEIPSSEVEVTDDEIQDEIDSKLSSLTTEEEVTDRAAQSGDTVNIDYKGTIDGVEFDGGTAEGYDLELGSGTFIDDFETQIEGHNINDEFNVEVTFPDDYSKEELAGKDAVFAVKLNSIKAEVTPELTDDTAKELDYESVDDMKAQIKEDLVNTKKKNYFYSNIDDLATFKELPEKLVNDQVDINVAFTKQYVTNYGMSFEDYLSSSGVEDEAAYREQIKSSCESSIKANFYLQYVYQKEKLKIDDSDSKEYLGSTDLDEYYENYGKGYINQYLKTSKALDFVCENAVIKTTVESSSESSDAESSTSK